MPRLIGRLTFDGFLVQSAYVAGLDVGMKVGVNEVIGDAAFGPTEVIRWPLACKVMILASLRLVLNLSQ